MKQIFNFRFQCRRAHNAWLSNSSAFIILELLTATAVLALILAVLLQITAHTLKASRSTTQQLDSAQSARRVLDTLSSDIANAATTGGATLLCQPGNPPTLAMLTSGRGPTGGATPRFMAVTYKLTANNELTRGYSPILYTTPGLLDAAATAPANTSILSNGILQFSIFANLENGQTFRIDFLPASAGASGTTLYQEQTAPTGWTALVPASLPSTPNNPRVCSLQIAIAVVDDQSFALLKSVSQLPTFTQPTSDPVGTWESELKITSELARNTVRFHSKVIPLP